MLLDFEIINEHAYPLPDSLQAVISHVLTAQSKNNKVELSLAFIDDEEMKVFYGQYFGYAQSTDVLSFPSSETNPLTGALILGDILIAYPFVQKQAAELNNNLDAEIKLLLIHGLLHLLGYDHDTESNKTAMWKLQNQFLQELDIQIRQIPE